MSEANLEVQIEYETRVHRDKAIEFLNDEGPTFEDEVEKRFRIFFPLQDDVEQPEILKSIDEQSLYALFEVFGAEGFDRAQDYIELFVHSGAAQVFGFFKDDEDTELFWVVNSDEVIELDLMEDENAEAAELLLDLEGPELVSQLITLYQNGNLTSSSKRSISSKPIPSDDKESNIHDVWFPEDKEWMKQRKKSWKEIKKVLRKSEFVERKNLKSLEEYYFTGKDPGLDEIDRSFLRLHHKLWWHPDQSQENWDRIIRDASELEYEIAISEFHGELRVDHIYFSDFGFMGGLEQRMLEVFPLPDTPPAGKDMSRAFTHWGWKMYHWLTEAGANPYNLRQYELDYIFKCLNQINAEDCKMRGGDPYNYLTKILWQCANFIDPRALPGEETTQRAFVEKMRSYLDTTELPEFIGNLWAEVRTRKGRSKWWESSWEDFKMDSEWQENPRYPYGFLTFMLHGDKVDSTILSVLHKVFEDLGFTDDPFNPGLIEKVELSNHMSQEMYPRMGFEPGNPVPAMKYRILTNSNYVDHDEFRIDVDIILPELPSSLQYQKDTPVLLFVPRPAAPYLATLSHQLNERMVRRLFQKTTGRDLLRYIKIDGKISDKDKADPFYNVEYQPLKSGCKALVTTDPQWEFPGWKES